jgi:hypothetical protein
MNPVTLSLSKGAPVMVRQAHHDRNERPRISISSAKLNRTGSSAPLDESGDFPRPLLRGARNTRKKNVQAKAELVCGP